MSTVLQPDTPPRHRFPLLPVVLVVVAVFGMAIYANLSFTVTNRANFRYFPPFKPNVDRNDNRHLGAEYLNIAKSLYKGEGYSSPFPEPTGPTAWMPPVLTLFQAGLWWSFGGDLDSVVTAVVFCQVYALVATGLLSLVLAWRCGRYVGAWLAALGFLLVLVCEFRLCFQVTHDCWIVMLALDVVLAGFLWARPLRNWTWAAAWGLAGGVSALISPMVALVWGALSLGSAWAGRAWKPFAVAVLLSALALAPWVVRNFLVFGRLIPIKSNLAYELYQSQCLQSDGMIQRTTFTRHPYSSAGPERSEYKALGEMAFVDKKSRQFWDAVWADPLDFLDRAAHRVLGVTVWYVPFDRDEPVKRPYAFWLSRLTHPLPFVFLLILVLSAPWRPLRREQWAVIAAYGVYLLPYMVASYYERYGVPLVGVKVLLVVWGVDRVLTLAWPGHSRPRPVSRRASCNPNPAVVPASR